MLAIPALLLFGLEANTQAEKVIQFSSITYRLSDLQKTPATARGKASGSLRGLPSRAISRSQREKADVRQSCLLHGGRGLSLFYRHEAQAIRDGAILCSRRVVFRREA